MIFRKPLIILLFLISSIFISSCNVNARYLVFSVTDEYAVLFGSTRPIEGRLTIPRSYQGLPVIIINDWAFMSELSTPPTELEQIHMITSLTIPNTIIEIRSRAFSNNKIERITLPNSLLIIGNDAFNGNKIREIFIPYGVHTIQERAFFGNPTDFIVLPGSVQNVGHNFVHRYTNVFTYHHSIDDVQFWAFTGRQVFWYGEWHYNRRGKPVPNY